MPCHLAEECIIGRFLCAPIRHLEQRLHAQDEGRQARPPALTSRRCIWTNVHAACAGWAAEHQAVRLPLRSRPPRPVLVNIDPPGAITADCGSSINCRLPQPQSPSGRAAACSPWSRCATDLRCAGARAGDAARGTPNGPAPRSDRHTRKRERRVDRSDHGREHEERSAPGTRHVSRGWAAQNCSATALVCAVAFADGADGVGAGHHVSFRGLVVEGRAARNLCPVCVAK